MVAKNETQVVTVNFTRERETKNTIRFQEVAKPEDAVIGTLYVGKAHVPADVQKLTLTLTVTE